MADLRQIFEEALKEEGVKGAEVMHTQETFADVIHVRKFIDGEPVHYKEAITFTQQQSWGNHTRQHVACIAAEVAHQFTHKVKNRREWGENVVDINTEDDTASCIKCGAEVELDDLQSGSVLVAESTVPQPVTNSYEDLPQYKKQFALLALLRDECEPYCSNSPYDPKNQYHRKI